MVVAERTLSDAYYDDTDLEDLYHIPVVFENPTWAQKKEIELYKTLYRGVLLVTGKARQGKDLFGVTFSKLNKLYFKRPIILDFKPKRLFGEYIYFDPSMMVREINKMAKSATLNRMVDLEEPMTTKQEDVFSDASQDWIGQNETLFKNAIWYLSELKRYCYNRNPMGRMNKAVGSVCDIHGHLDLLVLGTHIDHREIDYKSFLQKVSIWAHCKWSLTKPNNTVVTIRRGSYISEMGSFDVALKPFRYWVDGAMPRGFLTIPDSVCSITPLSNKWIEAKAEEIKAKIEIEEASRRKGNLPKEPLDIYYKSLDILSYLLSLELGISTVEEIVKHLNIDLTTVVIGAVCFLVEERLIACNNNLFSLYNTKNPVNLKPVLPKEMAYV